MSALPNFFEKRILFSLLLATSQGVATASDAKHIQAPPEDIGILTVPKQKNVGTRTHTAMIPIKLQQQANGDYGWTAELKLGGAIKSKILVLSPEESDWKVSAVRAGSPEISLAEVAKQHTPANSPGMLSTKRGFNTSAYDVNIGKSERSSISIRSNTIAAAKDRSDRGDGILLVTPESQFGLYSYVTTNRRTAGNSIGVAAYLYDKSKDSENRNSNDTLDAPPPQLGAISSIELTVTAPDGVMVTMPMYDDGLHSDELSNDGIYGSTINNVVPGNYSINVLVDGVNEKNAEIVLTSEAFFPVVTKTIDVQSQVAHASLTADDTLRFSILGKKLVPNDTPVEVYAELWGSNRGGKFVPATWFGGVVTPKANGADVELNIEANIRWLARAFVDNGFELRNIRIQDVDTHAIFAQIDRLDVAVDNDSLRSTRNKLASMVTSANPSDIPEITEEMLMGKKPAKAVDVQSGGFSAAAPDLMLVHGWCSSGDAWPGSHFSNAFFFYDPGVSRSNNSFALQIKSQGSSYPKWGGVGHSQGGNALLELYTKYYSGLDYTTTGSRLIQTLASPYRGTYLASWAGIASFFGYGCGSNYDLTYDGAAAWLSTIPTWARAKVFYYTTTFKDVWWRYDYCDLVTDVLLSDPEDGVTENYAGQLSGATNNGLASGECHRTGMRDPSALLNSGRNTYINSNARR